MAQQFTPVASRDALDHLVARSAQAPVILFKHDTTCPISAAAYHEMSQLDDQVALVDVDQAREVSHDIAARTGIRHESPQVIVLHQGQCLWSASHYEIRRAAVEQALQQVLP